MKKILLIGFAGILSLTSLADNQTLKNIAVDKMSPNGVWASGSSTVENSVIVWNPSNNGVYTITEFSEGRGNSISNEGIVIGFYQNGATVTPRYILNGIRKDITLPETGTAFNGVELNMYEGPFIYNLSNNLQALYPSGITPDGKKVVGYWKPWFGFTLNYNDYFLTTLPFVADFDSSTGKLSNFVILPFPNYSGWDYQKEESVESLKATDYAGGIPDKITAQYISEDGKTIVGLVSNSKGQHFYPVIWKYDGSKWSDARFPTIENIDEVPAQEPEASLPNPMYVESYQGYTNMEASTLFQKYLTDPKKQEEFLKIYYNDTRDYGPDSPEEIKDFVDEDKYEQLLEDYDKWVNWNDPDAENGYWKSYDKWIASMDEFYSKYPFFDEFALVVNQEGSLAACVQSDIIGHPEDKNFIYHVWSVDLSTGKYEKFQSKYDKLNPHQLLANGDIMAHTTNGYASYIHPAKATDFIPAGQYLKATNPDAYKYILENLGMTKVPTTTWDDTKGEFMQDEVLVTGWVFMPNDLKVLYGGIADFEGGTIYSFYLDNLGTEIVAGPEGTSTPRSGVSVPGLSSFAVNWDYQPITLSEGLLNAITVIYADKHVSKVTGGKVVETADGYQLVLSVEEYAVGGDVTITIPAGLVNIDCWGLGYIDNESMTIEYHVAATLDAPEVDPEEGIVESFSGVTLTWEEGTVLVRYPNPDYKITIDHNGVEIPYSEIASELKDNKLTITLNKEQTEAGIYTVNVSGGYAYIEESGDMTPEVNLVYYIIGAEDHVDVDPAPNKTYSELDKVVVTYSDIVEKHPEATAVPTLTSSALTRANLEVDHKFEGASIIFDLSKVEPGVHTLVIPEKYVKIGEVGNWNNPVTLVYTLDKASGVNVIGTDVEGFRVYNLNGVNVLNTHDASAVKALRPGIYIINGKKVVIR